MPRKNGCGVFGFEVVGTGFGAISTGVGAIDMSFGAVATGCRGDIAGAYGVSLKGER